MGGLEWRIALYSASQFKPEQVTYLLIVYRGTNARGKTGDKAVDNMGRLGSIR